MTKFHSIRIAPLVLSAMCIPTAVVHAESITRLQSNLPVASCQSALPVYEGAIRKRPLAIQNEGEVTAFVTCAYVVTQNPNVIAMSFSSNNQTEATVTCTAVNGRKLYGSRTATLSKTLPA